MIITMRTILIAFLISRHVLPERLFALFAHERHLNRPRQTVCFLFLVAFRTVKPLFAAWSPDGNLCI